MSLAPERCLYCDGKNTDCGFCINGKPLDTQEDWDMSWGAIEKIANDLKKKKRK